MSIAITAADIVAPGPDSTFEDMLDYIEALQGCFQGGDEPWKWGALPMPSKEVFLEEMGKIWDNTKGDRSDQHILYIEEENATKIMSNIGVGPNRVAIARFVHGCVTMTQMLIMARHAEQEDRPA